MKKLLIIGATIGAACTSADADGIDRTRFTIGTYCYDRTIFQDESAVIDLKNAGIDFVCGCPPGTNRASSVRVLDFMSKHGIGWIMGQDIDTMGLTLPFAFRSGRGKLAETFPTAAYEKAGKEFTHHPAIWGLDVFDEPTAVDFPRLGEICEEVRRFFGGPFPFINLFPSYASVATNDEMIAKCQLGTFTYQEYIDQYCKLIPLDYLSVDYYPYYLPKPRGIPGFFGNLRMAADACQSTKRSLWMVLQANTLKGMPPLAEDAMRYQSYVAMAFGAELLSFGCWAGGWGANNVIDSATHKKTITYDRLKRVVGELHHIGDRFMRYRRVATRFVGYAAHPEYLKGSGCISEDVADTAYFCGVRAEDCAPLVIADLKPRCSAEAKSVGALFVVAADSPYDEVGKERKVVFHPKYRTLCATGTDGALPMTWRSDGLCEVAVKSNHAVLIEIFK